MIINLVHRVYNATNTWSYFHRGLDEAKSILRDNQYPSQVYEKIFHQTLEKIWVKRKKLPPDKDDNRKLMYIEYRGKITDEYVEKLIKTEAPIKPIITLKKIKALLPSLKVCTSKSLSSNLIYKFECSRCKTSYVGMTQRHFCSTFAPLLRHF